MKMVEVSKKSEEKQAALNISVLSFSEAQPTPGRINEGAYLDLQNGNKLLAMVVDGATALSSITNLSKEKVGGHFVAQLAKESMSSFFSINTDSENILLDTNNKLREALVRDYGINPENITPDKLPSASGVTAVIIDKVNKKAEFTQLGDTVALIVKNDNSVEIVFPPRINYEDTDHFTLEDGSGYGALNGKLSAKGYIECKTVSAEDLKAIILLTDGMIPPQENVGENPNWENVAQDIISMGLKNFYKSRVYLPKLMDRDLSRFPRFKQHDDATGVIIDFTGQIKERLDNKRQYFFEKALKNRPAMKLMQEAGLAEKSWRNVLEHSFVVGVVAEKISELLKLNKSDSDRITNTAFVHDWDKYYEKYHNELSSQQNDLILKLLTDLNPDKKLLQTTNETFVERALPNYSTTPFLEKLMCYIDDIVAESEIVGLNDRLNETKKRRTDLKDEFWENELALGNKIEQEIFDKLPKDTQKKTGTPSGIPAFIKNQIETSY